VGFRPLAWSASLGFQIFLDRHGKWRCYHRSSGSPIDLSKAPLGSAEFFAECNRIAEFSKAALPRPPPPSAIIRRVIAMERGCASAADLPSS
jgi:hypothetical protein